jgi:hypothetical protein
VIGKTMASILSVTLRAPMHNQTAKQTSVVRHKWPYTPFVLSPSTGLSKPAVSTVESHEQQSLKP